MRTDTASRSIAAPPETVARAFTEPEALAAWLPPDGMTGELQTARLHAGGGFRMVLRYDDAAGAPGKASEDSDVSEVRIVALTADRIVWAVDFPSDDPGYAGTMTMEWTLQPRPGGTEVTIRATDVPPGIRPEDHAVGLASSLQHLQAWAEQAG